MSCWRHLWKRTKRWKTIWVLWATTIISPGSLVLHSRRNCSPSKIQPGVLPDKTICLRRTVPLFFLNRILCGTLNTSAATQVLAAQSYHLQEARSHLHQEEVQNRRQLEEARNSSQRGKAPGKNLAKNFVQAIPRYVEVQAERTLKINTVLAWSSRITRWPLKSTLKRQVHTSSRARYSTRPRLRKHCYKWMTNDIKVCTWFLRVLICYRIRVNKVSDQWMLPSLTKFAIVRCSEVTHHSMKTKIPVSEQSFRQFSTNCSQSLESEAKACQKWKGKKRKYRVWVVQKNQQSHLKICRGQNIAVFPNHQAAVGVQKPQEHPAF